MFSGWSTIQNATITNNNLSSPEGVQNAAKITDDSTSGNHRLFQSVTTSAASHTFSIFLKKGTITTAFLRFYSGSDIATANVDLDAGTITATAGSAVIEDFGNDWYRCSITGTAVSGTSYVYVYMKQLAGYSGSGQDMYLYGAQIEAGSYPTSYIPTYGSSVSRVVDSCAATSVSDVIGQEQGTFYWEGSLEENPSGTNMQFALSDGTTSQQIKFVISSSSTYVAVEVKNGGVQQFYNNHNIDAKTNRKYAIAYNANDFAFYIDGTQIATDTSGSVPACSNLSFDSGVSANGIHGNFKSVILFPTRLTNAELAALTTL